MAAAAPGDVVAAAAIDAVVAAAAMDAVVASTAIGAVASAAASIGVVVLLVLPHNTIPHHLKLKVTTHCLNPW